MSHRGDTAGPAAVPLDRAAGLLRRARRVLVTGLEDATLEAVQAACDVAESLGAAIDAGAADAARPTGPIVARAGGITADFEELRDRADLVILWCCDPDACQPGFRRDHLEPPLAAGGGRLVLAVGPEPAATGDRHLPLPPAAAVDAARLVHAILLGHEVPPGNAAAAALADTCRAVAAAIAAARCVGLVTCRGGDRHGLDDWAVRLLVRSINRERPAFAVPLDGPSRGLGNGAGAEAILTWRYGAAGAIARADRTGGEFRPAECSAAAIVARGEVDAVLAVGRLAPEVEAAIAARAADLAVVRLDDRDEEPPGCAGPCVHLRTSAAAGTVLRSDGRQRTLGEESAAGRPGSMTALLAALRDRLAMEAVR